MSYRAMAVLRPVKVVISDLPADFPQEISVLDFPGCEDKGSHSVKFAPSLYIEQDDFREASQN